MATKREQVSRSERGRKAKEAAARRGTGVAAKNATPEEVRFMQEHEQELSKSTLRAKWVHSPNEHEDRPGQTLATRSHEVIRHWAEARDAKSATVSGTEHEDRPGVLRFDFPGFGGQGLQEIGWDEWFKIFDARQLIFVFQEHKADGSESNFFVLDSPEREDG